ncbi:hypothetical protein GCM10010116_11480 [Microbispora rosea subsp. aerata]|nr:hypothetical protein [Microbispora rosea]GGO05849.1 hypothetical protein GCM10010116_11480 [Microbispora rosea subsp. aerata]GIH55243.1 hypothetical protein Mro02_21570 [Microbispora rosea subsp. aerata]GLJ82693.1 hypothetical protein GCM10017588_14180 [Microbispora rosea subsp. aerata]
MRISLGTLATATTLAAALSAAPAAADTEQRQARAVPCPIGHVCIYPDATPNGQPDTYYRYGSYNLSNVFGDRLVVNNQTGGAGLRLCTAYGGQNCGERLAPGSYVRNLSPINSILLEP